MRFSSLFWKFDALTLFFLKKMLSTMPNLLSTIKLMREMEAAQDLSRPFPSDHYEWRCTSLNVLLVVVYLPYIRRISYIKESIDILLDAIHKKKNTHNLLFLLFFLSFIHISVMCFRCRLFYLFLFMCFQIFPKKKNFPPRVAFILHYIY